MKPRRETSSTGPLLRVVACVIAVSGTFYLAGGPARADGEHTPDADTILLWHFNEGTGPIAFDAPGNHFDGVVVADWTADGRFGPALDFGGGAEGSKYVYVADDDALTPGAPASPQAVTIDVWIRPTRLDLNNQMIIHKYQNHVPGNSDYLLLLTNDVLGFATRGTEVLQATLPATGRWYHVTAIANVADSRLYVDGVLVADGFLSPVPNGSAPFTVGGCIHACAGNNHSFAGTIDEVRLKVGVVPPVVDPALVIAIDEDSLDNGAAGIEAISFGAPFCGGPAGGAGDAGVCVNDDIAAPGRRTLLFSRPNDVAPLSGLVLDTGQVDDEGIFTFTLPDPQRSLQNGALFTTQEFFSASGAAADENNLDKIAGAAPLSRTEIEALVGQTVCAVVYDSDISADVAAGHASLKGATLGTTAFRVTSVTPHPAGGSYLPQLTVEVFSAAAISQFCARE